MGLEDEVRKALQNAVRGTPPLTRPYRDPIYGLGAPEPTIDALVRVSEAQNELLLRFAREIDQLRASGAVGDDER